MLATGRYKAGPGGNWSDEQRDATVERQYALGLVATRGVWRGLHYASEHARRPLAKQQVALVRGDIKTVQAEFRERVRENAFALLDDSQSRISEMLKAYGLTTAYAGDFVTKVIDAGQLTGQLNSPEVLGKILQNHVDFPRWSPSSP